MSRLSRWIASVPERFHAMTRWTGPVLTSCLYMIGDSVNRNIDSSTLNCLKLHGYNSMMKQGRVIA